MRPESSGRASYEQPKVAGMRTIWKVLAVISVIFFQRAGGSLTARTFGLGVGGGGEKLKKTEETLV